jgi:MFS family permease
MAIGIVAAGTLSDRFNPRVVLLAGCIATVGIGALLAPMLASGSLPIVFVFLAVALLVMGFVYGPLGAWLPSLFPPAVRYSGVSIAFNVGGVIGGALTPLAAQAIAQFSGLPGVGLYLAAAGGLSLVALLFARRLAGH